MNGILRVIHWQVYSLTGGSPSPVSRKACSSVLRQALSSEWPRSPAESDTHLHARQDG